MIARTVWLLLVVACGSGSSKERASCERAIKLCAYDEGMDACIKDVQETKAVMGDAYAKFLDCSSAATSCGEYVGCAAGGIGLEGMKQLDGMRRGMEKMMGDQMKRLTD